MSSAAATAPKAVSSDLSPEEFQTAIEPPESPSRTSQELSKTVPYKYKPLSEHHIRLIQITSLGHIPIVAIGHYDLDNCPPYWAISYHWDKDSKPRPFYADGQRFTASSDVVDILNYTGYHEAQEKTTSNLNEMLSYIGRRPGQERVLVWIDAVCINQEDNAEKAVQVAMMNQIYSHAAKVVIWLGCPKNDSNLAIDHLPSVIQWLTLVDASGFLPHESHSSALYKPSDQILAAVGHLYTRTWFNRVWVVQEVLLAKVAIFLCGTRSINYEVFGILTSHIIGTGTLTLFESPTAPADLIDLGARNMMLLQRFRGEQNQITRTLKGPSLARLLNNCRSRGVTEPVDRVWGFLGLAAHEVVDNVRLSIDYSDEGRANYYEAYIKFCQVLLLASWDMYILSVAPSLEKPPELPSWCPNFNSPSNNAGLIMIKEGTFSAGISQTIGVEQSLRFYLGSNHLSLTGNRVDYVDKIVHFDGLEKKYSHGHLKLTSTRPDHALWEQKCANLARDVYKTNGVPDAHWRTLTVNQLLQSPFLGINAASVTAQPDRDAEWLGSIGGGAASPRQAYHDYKRFLNAANPEEVTADPAFTPERRKLLSQFLSIVSNALARTYFSTRDGRIGLGPPDMKSGDCVCVFYGAATPFLLRFSTADSDGVTPPSQLIGDAYVDGIMYGQGITPGRGPEVFYIG